VNRTPLKTLQNVEHKQRKQVKVKEQLIQPCSKQSKAIHLPCMHLLGQQAGWKLK